VAVIDKGWLGGGNMGRNTTIIRSNYLWDESADIYETSMKLWEELPDELEYDFLFSQRGVLNLAHHVSEARDSVRRVKANVLNGVASQWCTPEQVKELCPTINTSHNIRSPITGSTNQPRAGIATHDHVPRALARKAAAAGVDLIQNTQVTGIWTAGDRV